MHHSIGFEYAKDEWLRILENHQSRYYAQKDSCGSFYNVGCRRRHSRKLQFGRCRLYRQAGELPTVCRSNENCQYVLDSKQIARQRPATAFTECCTSVGNISPYLYKTNGEGGPDYAGASSGKILFLNVAFPDDVFKYFSRRRAVPSDLTAT